VLGASRFTVNTASLVPDSPSVTCGPSASDAVGRESSSRIVPVAVAFPSVARVGSASVSVNVSSGSTIVSPITGTSTPAWVSPGAKVTMPEVAV
jgi:hypothetical protein